MMEIKTFVCNMLEENCYVVSDETKECVIIDCGAFYGEERDAIVRYIDNNQLKPVHLLATHGHLDHNFGNNTILEHYGLKPEVAEGDRNMMNNYNQQAQKFYGMQLNFELPEAGSVITDNQDITFGNHKLKVIPTPGHSKGSVTFYCKEENVAFTGDTLFQQSIGRTDLHGGSMMQIIQSLRILAQLPDETVVKPGHGNDTTIGRELESNPFMER
ncbi:MAG: MBL fold metallo-hydrolase [Prevotella sp.]|jgi:glyoxylase-like metal-dependent hydrolase (beta-lactamase superfamily II)|nr:MBL fold metallo-hydrolase [Prevotella sp.]MBQ9178075.1 MBL fold metallo-hydrolase [Prevotella sp.]MBQ9669668.1 MBL fold metallo-hydrolase [Prevotella sp.]MBR1527549.1 MBL fold metallo-hydrolase [Prevotella sp.]MDY6230377.1 MBL fold metallo-hydrolase [Prevotella sp.]